VLSTFDLEEHLVGEAGSSVALILRHGDGNIEDVTVERGSVAVRTVKGFCRDANGVWDYFVDPHRRIAYVRVSSFNHEMIRDFDAALNALTTAAPEDAGPTAAALVLDLRFNPGGLLPQAVAMVDRFVDSGKILTTTTRHGAVNTYLATPEATVTDIPIAVLVNGSSASASEIVAGALQDHDRAVIVGERTFGKGSVQHFIHLHGGRSGIRLTAALYQLPGGRMLHKTKANADTDAWGVTPDVVIPLDGSQSDEFLRQRSVADCGRDRLVGSAAVGEGGLDAIPVDAQLRAAMDTLAAAIGSGSLLP
jgi:carboxyl-terminal processing protease